MKKTYWFRAKTYGWGWVPATWQGWVILGIYVLALVLRATQLEMQLHTQSQFLIRFALEAIGLTIILIGICYLTGEPPKWRWGKNEKK